MQKDPCTRRVEQDWGASGKGQGVCHPLHMGCFTGQSCWAPLGLFLQAITRLTYIRPSVRSSLIARDSQSLCYRWMAGAASGLVSQEAG